MRKIRVTETPEENWSAVTWKGSRYEQMRRALCLTVRERLQAVDELGEMVRHFQQLRAAGKFKYKAKSIDLN